MADKHLYTELSAWEPIPTPLSKEWIALAKELGQQVKNSPHAYVLKVRYNAQGVGDLLRSWGLPWQVVMAGYLWDDDEEPIRAANLPHAEKILGHIHEANTYARYIEDENLPPLLSPPYRDIGGLLIAVAIYYQALQTLRQHNNEQPYRGDMLSQIESVGRILTNIATRLGMWHFKRQVEDLIECLKNPHRFAEDRQEHIHILKRDEYMLEVTRQLLIATYQEATQQQVIVFYIPCAVTGMRHRLENASSTATSQDVQLTGFDLVTFEVLVPSVSDCYTAIGIFGQLGYIPDGVIELIANPKPNGCSNVAFGLILKAKGPRTHKMSWLETQNHICQLQISTRVMHAISWYGCLYPDSYQLCGKNPSKISSEPFSGKQFLFSEEGKVFSTIRENLTRDNTYSNTQAPIVVYYRNRIPFALPKGATALDFAYAVSSEMGEHTIEAIVNNRKTALKRVLETGDIVEIRTTREIQAQDYWLHENYAVTPLARTYIKESLERRRRDRRGYHLLLQELERFHYILTPEAFDEQLSRLVKQYGLETPKAYLERLDKAGQPPYTPDWAAQGIIQQMAEHHEHASMNKSRPSWIPVLDVPPIAPKNPFRRRHLCDFCQPCYPSDPKIMGLLRDRGGELIVHKESCPHLIDNVGGQRSILFPMIWQQQHPAYRVTFLLTAHDRNGLVFDIAKQLGRYLCNFTMIQGEVTAETGDAWVRFTIETYTDTEMLDIWQELYQVDRVAKVDIDIANTPLSIRNHLQQLHDRQSGPLSTEAPQEAAWYESLTVPPPRNPILKNPFDVSRPATAKMFFGRAKETKMMQRELCEGEQGKALIMYGPRRSGKSSICKNFLDRQISQPFWGVLFSLQNFTNHSEETILTQLAEKICEEFIQQLERSGSDWPFYSDSDPQVRLRRILQDCVTQVSGARLILALDEFGGALEAFEKGMLDRRFFTFWKDLMDDIPQLSLILALPTSSHNLLTKGFSHEFSFAESLPVAFLDAESVERLLVDPLQDQNIIIRPHTVTRATKLTGGNPYYMTLIGLTLVNQLNREKDKQLVTDDDLLLIVDQLIEEGSYQNFDFLRSELQSREEFQILQAIVELTDLRTPKVQLKKIAEWLNSPVHIVKQHLDRLRIGLVLEENGSSSNPYYSFRIELVRLWLRRNRWFFISAI